MIAKLKGLVDGIDDGSVIIDVGGVGYLVFCSGRTLGRLQNGRAAALHVETHVREDHIHLYGFMDAGERDWFNLLITVQGVGAKVALAILTVATPEQLLQTIAAQDKALLNRAAGVGPKLAVRILTELKDKAGKMSFGAFVPAVAGAAPAAPADGGAMEDAVSALCNLGYKRLEAFEAVGIVAAEQGEGASSSILIRLALKRLGKALLQ
jgi:holliday junction DNA helicase RuvA